MSGTVQLWAIIIGLGVGSFLIRFVFLGFVGDRPLPAWLLRHLRYTAVAILPAMVAPLVVWPAGNDGTPHPAYVISAGTALVLGYVTKNVALAVTAGALALYVLLTVF